MIVQHDNETNITETQSGDTSFIVMLRSQLYGSDKMSAKAVLAELRRLSFRPLNASALDFLLERQDYIPTEWDGTCTFFFGTIFKHIATQQEYVRFLYRDSGQWQWSFANMRYPLSCTVSSFAVLKPHTSESGAR